MGFYATESKPSKVCYKGLTPYTYLDSSLTAQVRVQHHQHLGPLRRRVRGDARGAPPAERGLRRQRPRRARRRPARERRGLSWI